MPWRRDGLFGSCCGSGPPPYFRGPVGLKWYPTPLCSLLSAPASCTMDSPPKLSGETLIVHHIPLVHCQVSGSRKAGCAGSLLGDSPFIPPENLGLSRTTSLPERDILHGEALLFSSLFQTSSGAWVSQHKERKSTRGNSMASDDSSFTSSNSEEQITAHTLPRAKGRNRAMLRHNPFLCRPDGDEDERDGLSGYQEDCSFSLHGDTMDFHSFSSEPFHLHSSGGPLLFDVDPDRPLSCSSNVSMDCGEQDWADDEAEEDHMVSRPEAFAENQAYASDSSCNSSDGVLVNFSAIYSKLNNAVPEQPQWPEDSNQNRLDSPGKSGAFYLDLHSSPTELPHPQLPLLREPLLSTSSCSAEHQAFDLDNNCNSCPPMGHSELAPCLQSQARLVVATQNYYKLVTCDLSQSSPSPAGSSANSSDEQSRGSPTPNQPNHYFLFRQQPAGLEEEQEEESPPPEEAADEPGSVEGQVYVNVSPPRAAEGRPRSRSYDCSLELCQCPQRGTLSPCQCPRLGAMGRMLSCPVKLSEGGASAQATPPRVTSFAEIARSKRRAGAGLHSPTVKPTTEPSPPTASSLSSTDFSPILEHTVEPSAYSGPHSQGPIELVQEGPHVQHNTQGGDCPAAVVRYSKEQRPTTLPIQPFTFQHQFPCRPARPQLPQPSDQMPGARAESTGASVAPSGGSVRPSPLGSYSPAQFLSSPGLQSAHTSSSSLSADEPPRQSPLLGKHTCGPSTPPLSSLAVKRGAVPPVLPALQGHMLQPGDTVSSLGYESKQAEALRGTPARSNAHHLSPQALKWKEYRRRNPLAPRGPAQRPVRHNVFDFPPAHTGLLDRLNGGQQTRLQQTTSDWGPEYLSLTERPPEEFCLSPDTSSYSSSQTSLSVDLRQKRALVKAVNTAVDLIVAHFGTTRDPGIKSKLGNSWVSPNVGHLILKYLCPALHDLLRDGLKAYVLDLIIGQRRCRPWSLVEASTQPGPSTRLMHSLYSKISQFSELTSPSMRLNAFIVGLLNLKSLEFWFSHLHTHEDIIAAHYHPWGFLLLSHGACRPLFEELLLLLQPLSLLPFDLDLLFEPHLLQKGQEQLRRKEMLCFTTHSLQQSERSTFQLMRGQSSSSSDRGSETDQGQESSRPAAGGSTSRQERQERQERQSGWWYQLMQSSQVYIDQSTQASKFTKVERRRRSSERQSPPTREGVVEGAESGPEEGAVLPKGRLSWMGSPPECVLSRDGGAPVEEQGPRWGHLFGSTGSSSQESRESRRKTQSRTPSGWLRLDSSIFTRVAQTISAGSEKRLQNQSTASPAHEAAPTAQEEAAPTAQEPVPPVQEPATALRNTAPAAASTSPCVVRALCHHEATEPGHLSFHRGDVLRVVRRSDPDTLLCSRGDAHGLVPIVYVTLGGAEDSLYQSGTAGQEEHSGHEV